jgi:hydrogenase expression/formation protein HypC
MCLAVPAELVEIDGNRGVVETGGIRMSVGLDLIDNAMIGDYLIIHAGYALEKIDVEEARKRLALFQELAGGGQRNA